MAGQQPAARSDKASKAAQPSASAKRPAPSPLITRCTYGHVWPASVKVSPKGRQLAVAVQHLPGWLEVWLFHQGQGGWQVDALRTRYQALKAKSLEPGSTPAP